MPKEEAPAQPTEEELKRREEEEQKRQHENELKLTMYERAKVDPTKIPELIGRNAPALRFVPDTQNPYFCYTLNSNSREKNRDVMEVLEQLLEDMSLLLCGEKAADCE